MTRRVVKTQAELDAALATKSVSDIVIESPAGVWLGVSAYGSASVSAYGSASVSAYDWASVSAYDSASVSAGKYVSVHVHSQRVTRKGGVLIDMTAIDKHTAKAWCDWQGVDVKKGRAVVYKAVNADMLSGRGVAYLPGSTVTAPDWAPTDACGGGLHFGPTPTHAEAYCTGSDAPRFVACRIALAEAVGITGAPTDTAKIKAAACEVLYECDAFGRRVESAAVGS